MMAEEKEKHDGEKKEQGKQREEINGGRGCTTTQQKHEADEGVLQQKVFLDNVSTCCSKC